MPTPGYVFKDGGTTPIEEKDPNSEFRKRITQAQKPITATQGPLAQESSTSHELATADDTFEVLGAAQKAGKEDRITNLGWQRNGILDENLVGNLPNPELWTLVRRFNKQMYHVKEIPVAPPGGLDLNIADNDDFSPDKIRSNIERLYMTVIISMIAMGKHIVRIRSWRETKRTSAFAGVYFLAWLIDMIVPTVLLTAMILITVPRVRNIMFPPAPIALVDGHTGGIQKPKAGVLGSHDSATGAPEKYQGEAVEQEASNLVTGIASVAIASAAGRHDQANPDDEGGSKVIDGGAPDPTKMASAAADAASAAQGGTPEAAHDKTKQPMEEEIWAKMRPFMHVLGDIADGWERLANALSPTPPFSQMKRLQLAAIVAPMFLVSLFVKSQWVIKGTTFIVGAAFFTDPLQQQGIAWLNINVPDWPKYLEIRNTLLKGVPTNAQLTITLLRIGEANRAPLPPPPKSHEPPKEKPAELDKEELADSGLDASQSDIEDAITVDVPPAGTEDVEEEEETEKKKKKGGVGQKLLAAFKHTTAGAVETKLTADHARATLGSGHAKQKLGVLPSKSEMRRRSIEGPVEFKGRFQGRKGAVYIDSSVSPPSGKRPASPCVYFTTHLDQNEAVESMPKDPDFAVAITDIAELKKVGGLGWKGKIIVGWATNREVKDGLEIITRQGKTYRTMALAERDELFNRLCSMGQQVWESY